MSSSPSQQAERRKQASASIGWAILGLISFAALGVLGCRTVAEVVGLFAGVSSKESTSPGKGSEGHGRDSPRVASDKVSSCFVVSCLPWTFENGKRRAGSKPQSGAMIQCSECPLGD